MPPSLDPTLIIPGTQATTLVDNAGVTVYNVVRLGLPLVPKALGKRPKSGWVALMSMEHSPPAAGQEDDPAQLGPQRTSLEDGTDLRAGVVALSAYALFPKYYEEWPYEWRADLRWNAARLLAELRDRVAAGGKRVNLIGHSQGGLLIVLASKLANANEFANLVARVVLVGAPLAGTMRAVEALTIGSEGLGKEQRDLALAMARTWPALYQMLPAWPCVADGNGVPAAQQLLDPAGWPAASNAGIDPGLLDRARRTQAMLANPFDAFGRGVTVTNILGKNQTTGVRMPRTANAFGDIVYAKNAGDSLVPYDQTLAWGPSSYAHATRAFANKTRPHGELCVDNYVAQDIINAINAAPATVN